MLRIVKINADAATSAPPSMTARRDPAGVFPVATAGAGASSKTAGVSGNESSAAASVLTNAGSSAGKTALCGAPTSSNVTSDSGLSGLDSSSVSVNGNDGFSSSAGS